LSANHDWLNLLEVSGPFLAVPVLREVFPQGFEELGTSRAGRLRSAYEEWRDAVDAEDADLDRLHRAWIDEVLRTGLEVDDSILRIGDGIPASATAALPEHDATIIPDIVLVDPTHGGALLTVVHIFEPDIPLTASMKFDGLSCSPADRMALHLRALGKPFGLVTNGEQWMLVHAPAGHVATFASWYARIWGQEPETLRALASLLSVRRFFAPEQDRLPALFERSLRYQDEVTDALGDQVRRAIEVLVQALDRADQDRNRELLRDVSPQEFYEAGLTVMMRLVFLLAAEERGLLLLGEPRYDSFYAVSTLRMQLRAESDEILERRHAAWSRLLAVFRAVFGGIEHPTLRLQAMGGSLFDPDRYPFLEGRPKGTLWRQRRAEPLPIDDRTVLHILEALQTVTIRRSDVGQQSRSENVERRTLSYRALDIEQIGHVYEGLLERTVARVEDVTLELGGGDTPELARATLGELESARSGGQSELVELLAQRSSRSPAAIRKLLAREGDAGHSARLLGICRGDVELRDRVLPYARLIRTDVWGSLLVHLSGAFVVVLGANRRETGTHYTPKHVAQAVVEETLAPLVYRRPAPESPRSDWQLRTSAELLRLKICDPAMGSGAFLVQSCRYLAARVVEAWTQEENVPGAEGAPVNRVEEAAIEFATEGEPRALYARQLVAERCLYGADLNPLAVELAKLSLWLVTLAKSRPFGFLDHHLRCGDALLGIGALTQLTELSVGRARSQAQLFGAGVRQAVKRAVDVRTELELMTVRDMSDVGLMSALNKRVFIEMDDATSVANAMVGALLVADGARALQAQLADVALEADRVGAGDPVVKESMARLAHERLSSETTDGRPRIPLHWPLVFPEAVTTGGFDAVIGNPPWVSYAGRAAQPLADCLRRYYSNAYVSFAGYRNLQGLFIERVGTFVRPGGRLGLVIPSSMAELDGYAPVRAAHDRFAVCDAALPNLPEHTFRNVNQPSMILYSTVRATRLEQGSGAPWPMDRPDLDALALGALQKLDRAPLPPSSFGERGLQTSGADTDHLTEAIDDAHTVALRVGGDIQAFRRGPPTQYADSSWFGGRLRDSREWKAVHVLIRQTARVPTAARSDGVGFRNSILAGFGSTEYPPDFLVAYLNSTPIRWRHYFRNRDARLGMPQVKIGHLRAIPAPSSDVVDELNEIGRRLNERNDGVTREEQLQVDRIVGRGFGLTATELERMHRDSARWSAKTAESGAGTSPTKRVSAGRTNR
jgi:hypothetical protein